jgi:aminomethyltransferase
LDLSTLQHSPLESRHLAAGGKLVPFSGWALPVQYDGILAEHQAVRSACGVFDISHMGQLLVQAPERVDATAWLNRVLSNDVTRLEPGQGQYTLLLNDEAGIIDDLIVYRREENAFLLIVNAARREEDLDWLTRHAPPGMALVDRGMDHGAIAVQGPDARRVFSSMMPTGAFLPPRFGLAEFGAITVCRTGYTGEDGFELCAPAETLGDWWDKAVTAGAKPCGLGARDLLRLEKCYPLNGNDLSPQTTPLEAGLGFAVAWEKEEFPGSGALREQRRQGPGRKLVALKVIGKTPPPRPEVPVFSTDQGGEPVGRLTSGGFSPGLKTGIALGFVPAGLHHPGTRLWIEIRANRYPAEVVPKPFV